MWGHINYLLQWQSSNLSQLYDNVYVTQIISALLYLWRVYG
jgi:hypothetical protein